MSRELIATGLAAAAVLGAAAMTSVAPIAAAGPAVRPVVFDVPAPREPAPSPEPATQQLPTAQQLTGILENLADPSASYQDKTILVQGGLSPRQGHELDHMLRQAEHNGALPLSFTAENITATGANTASADITASGPKLPAPITKNITFANQGGWMLSYDSVQALMEEAMPQH